MSNVRSAPGSVRDRVVSPQISARLDAEGAGSPLPKRPDFLKGLPDPGVAYAPKRPVTKKLKKIIEANGYESAFTRAISKVSTQNIPELYKIQTLDQFYFYVDALVRWMPGLRVWEWKNEVYHERTDYLRITQFYYYFNQSTLQKLQSPIHPKKGKTLTPISEWLRDFAVEWGAFLDTKESARYLKSYLYGPEYAYQDYDGGKNGVQNYKTFNEWFSRTFRNIDRQRPVAQPDDDRIVTFPAESTFVGQWAVSTPVKHPPEMKADSSIVVKHIEWPIPELLQKSKYRNNFEGGVLVHSFLNVYDYHRQHAPASGKILEAKFIPGQVYLDVALEVLDPEQRAEESSALANAVVPRRYLNAADPTGYQFVQCRGLMVLQTKIGKIAVLPMGMAQVSSVVFVKPGTQDLIRLSAADKRKCHDDCKEPKDTCCYDCKVKKLNEKLRRDVVGRTVKKGDMISTFLFGGSDIVTVFERQANINITAQVGVHYPIRSQMAYSNIAREVRVRGLERGARLSERGREENPVRTPRVVRRV